MRLQCRAYLTMVLCACLIGCTQQSDHDNFHAIGAMENTTPVAAKIAPEAETEVENDETTAEQSQELPKERLRLKVGDAAPPLRTVR